MLRGFVSANASYERTTQDILVLTGLNVSRGTQQRLVHRQTFELPMLEDTVEEMSIDGGKVRIRTPQGEICRWQDLHCRQFAPTLSGSLLARQ
ncbi:MAG: hypothetical protein N4J56_006929 [Chroococcidiopsis sp. SAG 2025]|nr:hypothetical protein [Chroococcidiopsis sp. SAG 2025]